MRAAPFYRLEAERGHARSAQFFRAEPRFMISDGGEFRGAGLSDVATAAATEVRRPDVDVLPSEHVSR